MSIGRNIRMALWVAWERLAMLLRRHPARLIGIGAALVAAAVSLLVAPGMTGFFGACLAVLAVAIAVEDWQSFRIPNSLTGLAFAVGLLFQLNSGQSWTGAVSEALLRSAVCAVVFLLIRIAYRRLRERQGLGLGDVKLALVAGVWLDWAALPAAVEVAALSTIGYWLWLHFCRAPMTSASRVPFGLFFAPAIWLCWLVASRDLSPWTF